MEKINYNNLDQDLYYFVHKTGLKVYLLPYENKNNYYAVLGTRYGSIDTEFDDNDGKHHKTPDGVAHFLEHKVFEQKEGVDPFKFFAQSGVSTNAATSFDSTKYYIWGINDLLKNLSFLLDFVFTPHITKENVEKEVTIIKEEIDMYEDNPEWVLDDTMRKNLFYELPIKEKIAGTYESIDKITADDLITIYKNFYNPNNMCLIVAGNFDPYELEDMLNHHEKLNSFKKKYTVKRQEYKEKDDVKEEYQEIKKNITIPKLRYSLKINKKKFKDFTDREVNLYIGILIFNLFGSISDFREHVYNNNLSTGFFIERNNFQNFLTLDITAESEKADMFIDEVNATLKNIKIDSQELERTKRVWAASEIRMIDSIDLTVDNIYSDFVLYGEVYYDRVEQIKNINIKKLTKFLKYLDVNNKSIVLLLPEEND